MCGCKGGNPVRVIKSQAEVEPRIVRSQQEKKEDKPGEEPKPKVRKLFL
jgi:hypothetical protein